MVWTLSRVEGVPADHIVHVILDAVEQLPITDFRVNERGSGSEQYPPRMMLALLIYCYATGRFGSRTIEAVSYARAGEMIAQLELEVQELIGRARNCFSGLTHRYAQVRPKWRQPFV